MKIVGLSCIAFVLAEDTSEVPTANRSLLNARSLADGRRLAINAKCEVELYPFVYGNKAPFADGTETRGCTSALPALKVTDVNAVDNADGAETDASMQTSCCKAAPLCSTTYVNHGVTAGTGQTACGTTGNQVPADLSCYTTDGATAAKCGTAVADHSSALDVVHCCRQMCNDATGGFELTAASAAKPDCPTTGGDYQVSTTAYCAGQACAASDQAACCQKKCSSGFVLFGVTKVTADGQDQNCADGADQVSSTAYCAGSTCAATDAATCCQNKCTDGYELFGGTTTGKRQCADTLRVSPDAYCSGPTCASSDDATCCETKCDKAAAGFELHGGSTTGMTQCAKDLRVHPTEYCDGTDCSSHGSTCCQQKCSAGFKVKGATGTGTECAKDLTVHATGYCAGSSCAASDAGTCCQQKCSKGWKLSGATTKESNTCPKDTTLASDGKCTGSPCAAADDKLCCNEKCTDSKKGFKVHKGTGKEPNECKKGEILSTKGMCKGDCSSDDASTCCLKANNSTATTDANSAGLAAAVGMLIIMSAAA